MQAAHTIRALIFVLVGAPLILQAGEITAQQHRLLAVGDIMLSGSGESVFKIKGYTYAFQDRDLARLVAGADVAFANLEFPITRSGSHFKEKDYIFRGPIESLRAIRTAGFDLLSLANNHIMDYGHKGLMDTIRQCRQNRLVCAGAGPDLDAATRPGTIIRQGIRYGLLAYSLTFPEDFWASPDKSGTAHPDIARMELDIRAVRPAVDILIVSFHWGEELMNDPKPYQVGFAHYAIRTGADVVIGHHPHVPQPVEIYRGKPVFYSLGNYVFGSFSDHVSAGIAAEVVFKGRNPVMINLYPIDVDNRNVGFQPRLAKGPAAQKMIGHLQSLSSPFNTTIECKNGIGRVMTAPASSPAITSNF